MEVADTPGIEVIRTFDSNIFSGVSVETESYNADSLASLPDVVKVWLNERVELLPINSAELADGASALNYTTHNATGVGKLHELGIFGQGVKVGVVDTGIYYNHTAVGRVFCMTRHHANTGNSWATVSARVSRWRVATTSLAMAVCSPLGSAPDGRVSDSRSLAF